MNGFLEDLAARRRFGMKPGLETIQRVCATLGNPQDRVSAIHIAGTNGKGAVAAILEACLRAAGWRMGRYTSPHLVALNERFFLDGRPADDARLEACARTVRAASATICDLTFFEALTAVAFQLYAEERVECCVLETGLGGRLDATNICVPRLTIITRIGLDHCDWLGDTVEAIAAEKAGIIKPGVPVVLGANVESVRELVRLAADERNAPFFYAPDLAGEADIPTGFSLRGAFNRENAVTALAALRVLLRTCSVSDGGKALSLDPAALARGFSSVIWPGRFQRVGDLLVDGAHNPPAAQALAAALEGEGVMPGSLDLVVGFCGDKDVDETIRLLKPFVRRAFAVRTTNPRSLEPDALAVRLRRQGIAAEPCGDLASALAATGVKTGGPSSGKPAALACGSLFLAGEVLHLLHALPWESSRQDPSELLRCEQERP